MGFFDSLFGGNLGAKLIKAAKTGDTEKVKNLLAAGADVNAKNRLGTPLHIVTKNGRLDLVTLLLSNGAKVNVPDGSLMTALHITAFFGRRDICNLLISKGAILDLPDERLQTPLHIAINGCHRDVVELLVEKGANVNRPCQDGRFLDIDIRPLFLAVHTEQEDIAKLLITKGADVNTVDRHGITPLHEAAGRGLLRTIELLIEYGADLNATTSTSLYEVGGLRSWECGGATPVKLAVLANRTEAVQLLSRYGGSGQ